MHHWQESGRLGQTKTIASPSKVGGTSDRGVWGRAGLAGGYGDHELGERSPDIKTSYLLYVAIVVPCGYSWRGGESTQQNCEKI